MKNTMAGIFVFKCIVIADDGSPEGERGATVGLGLASSFRAQVILLGIVGEPNIQAEGAGLPIEDPSAHRQRLEARFERLMRMGQDLEIKISIQIRQGEPAVRANP